ncbi:MAG TPA: endonuclease III [Polyangiaceae bacterium]|nr:endonuclease III [Polyangiaceae bacterium]
MAAAKKPSQRLEQKREQASKIYEGLQARHPDAHCELDHKNPFQLVVATVLSAQSTDVMVNKVTPELFKRWPDAAALAKAKPADVEKVLGKLGMFRQKSKNVIGLSQRLVDRHGGKVPETLAELVELPGVGRKTANVVLGVAFNKPEGVVVDTHVQRLSQRLGLTKESEPLEIEQDLMLLFPRERWDMLSHLLIFHGRRVCTARKPACAACPLSTLCPSAFKAEEVGRKAPPLRVANVLKKAKKAASRGRATR